MGRLTQEAETDGVTLTYAYDRRGNRTGLTATGTDNYTIAYTYNEDNRLTAEAKTVGVTVETTTYAYDNNGNNTSKTSSAGGGATYTYNNFNQLTDATVGTTTAHYTYNAQGIRTTKRVGTTTTTYYLDGGNVVAEKAGSTTTTYLRGANLIRYKTGTAKKYYLFNAHGDVVNITNASGNNLKAYSYDAFGNEQNPTSYANPFRYCGEYWDSETSTYYLRARYYDPSLRQIHAGGTPPHTAK